MKNSLLIVSIIIFLASCSSKKKEHIPDFVIPLQKMISVTTDLKLIEGAINLNHYNRNTDNKLIDSLYQSVYNKHNITKTSIDSSLEYYTKKPELLQAIFDSSLVQLKKLN